MPAFLLAVSSLLENEGIKDPRAKFLYREFRRFLGAYGRANFENAAVCGRRIAELFCRYALEEEHPARYRGLCEQAWAIDFWYMHPAVFVDGYDDVRGIATKLGMALSTWTIFDDVNIVRRYGNQGAHADDEQIAGYALEGSAEVFTATIRIAVSCIALFRLRPVTVSFPPNPYRSKI